MRRVIKIILWSGITIGFIALMINGLKLVETTMRVEAASQSGNTSDVQLLARAINRRSQRRTL